MRDKDFSRYGYLAFVALFVSALLWAFDILR